MSDSYGVEQRLRPLFEQGLAGDERAWRCLLETLARHLRAWLRMRVRAAPEDIEDLVQEVLLAVHLQRHTWNPKLPLAPWVQAIARYRSIDWLRARGARGGRHASLDEFDAAPPESLWLASETEAVDARNDLATLLARIPARQREALVLVKLEGLSIAEAAQASGQSESSIKVGIHRGLKSLAAYVRSHSS